MPADLHCHSTYSDGSTPIARLPLLAARAGLSGLALSDHDSLQSVQYALAHPAQAGVHVVPAVELSAYDYEREHRVHLLCYWPRPRPALAAHCEAMSQRRSAACLQSAEELEALYPQFKKEDALAYAQESGVLYKAHIMRALMELGECSDIYGSLYLKLFALRPVRGKVIHTPEYFSVEQVLATARAAGGAVVFAHPSVYKSMPLVRALAERGAIDGVEIEHPRNTEADKAELRALAQQYGLLATGGTDFHGSQSGTPHPLGSCTTPEDTLRQLAQIARTRWLAAGVPEAELPAALQSPDSLAPKN